MTEELLNREEEPEESPQEREERIQAMIGPRNLQQTKETVEDIKQELLGKLAIPEAPLVVEPVLSVEEPPEVRPVQILRAKEGMKQALLDASKEYQAILEQFGPNSPQAVAFFAAHSSDETFKQNAGKALLQATGLADHQREQSDRLKIKREYELDKTIPMDEAVEDLVA